MIDLETLVRPLRPSPFRALRPAIALACLYGLAAVVWLTLGDALPGGRWFAVHLFTLGVLTNLVVALTRHFTQKLLRTVPSRTPLARLLLLNAGALLVLGFPPALRWPLAIGATMLAGAVAWLLVELRAARRAAPEARFAYAVRGYEHAAWAFIAGAVLGGLLGAGVVPGAWYGGVRLAHLHANILGWGGLTLLATVVFLGPAMMRTQMEAGADRASARGLSVAAGGLLAATVALVLTGAGGLVGDVARLAAAASLAAYAAGATSVCRHVIRAGRRAKASAPAWMIRASCTWLIAVVWANAAVVASGRWRLLDALGAALIVAVLGQAILAALDYLAPMVWGGGPRHRSAVRARLGAYDRARPAGLNTGVGLVVVAAVAGPGAGAWSTVLAWSGWSLVGAVVVLHVVLLARGVLATEPAASTRAR